jgi:hypothetical protein
VAALRGKGARSSSRFPSPPRIASAGTRTFSHVTEYPIARLYADARVTRIYGGTSEVMKSIISKSLGL